MTTKRAIPGSGEERLLTATRSMLGSWRLVMPEVIKSLDRPVVEGRKNKQLLEPTENDPSQTTRETTLKQENEHGRENHR
jgi:hypothetical protein